MILKGVLILDHLSFLALLTHWDELAFSTACPNHDPLHKLRHNQQDKCTWLNCLKIWARQNLFFFLFDLSQVHNYILDNWLTQPPVFVGNHWIYYVIWHKTLIWFESTLCNVYPNYIQTHKKWGHIFQYWRECEFSYHRNLCKINIELLCVWLCCWIPVATIDYKTTING